MVDHEGIGMEFFFNLEKNINLHFVTLSINLFTKIQLEKVLMSAFRMISSDGDVMIL